MKVAFFAIKNQEKEFLEKKLEAFELKFFEDSDIKKHIKEIANTEILSVFHTCKVDSKILSALPNLKMIATRSTGFDHIDLEEAKKRNILVCNVPEYGSSTVAEYAFALILNIARKVYKFSERTDKADYEYKDVLGMDLFGKTIGVIGAGSIGSRVMEIASGFGMKILVYSRSLDKKFLENPQITHTQDLDFLLKNSDIVSVHLPLNESTKHIINTQNVVKMKKGVILINTSRGGVVANTAIQKGLKMGIISYAGLDVIENEEKLLSNKKAPLAKKLAELEEVVYSPHVAYYTKGAEQRILQTTVENIQKFAQNKPQNLV